MLFQEIINKIPLSKFLYGMYKICYLYVAYVLEFKRFKNMTGAAGRFQLLWGDRYPCLKDKTEETSFDRHYIYHPAWAARVLAQSRPEFHVDISSSLHFCSLASAFIPVKFYDYRPAEMNLSGLTCFSADLLSLPFADQSLSSLSCMHVVEHVGLGRYGDPIDPEGDLKAMVELKRVLAVNGNLMFVVPIGGTPMIMFNAHRIYSYAQIMEYFSGLELVEFALIPDSSKHGGLLRNADKKMADAQKYGCGCFWFRKGSQ